MNTSSAAMTESLDSDTKTTTTSPPEQLLPVPVPDWSYARPVWSGNWPAHIYGFGCAFLLVAVLSLASPPHCFWCRRSVRSTAATSTVSGIVGVVCLSQSCVLLVDAYHSTGRLPVALVQVVHGFVFPGIVATLTILDRVFSALVKPRQQLGSIKHPRLIAAALSVYFLLTLSTYLVIAVRPQTRLWLLLVQAVSLAWGCAAVFLVACQCLRLARYARVTARSRRQTAIYIRAKRHVDQRLESADDSARRCTLRKHLSRLRVARTKADEFVYQQQRMLDLDEQGFSDVDVQIQTSTTTDSGDQLPSDFEVTKTTTVKLSHNHFRYRHRSRRRRRHVSGSKSSTYGGSEAVRDFTVTALAAARLLWSPSPDSDGGQCDESPSWRVFVHPTDCRDVGDSRRRKLNDPTTGDRFRRDRRTSVSGTESDDDNDAENDEDQTDSSFKDRQHLRTEAANTDVQPASENRQNSTESGRAAVDEHVPTGLADTRESTYRPQLEPSTSVDIRRRNVSSVDASSRTCLLLGSSTTAAGEPLSRRLSSVTTRLLRHVAARWRKSRDVTSRCATDAESSRRVACVSESRVVDTSRDDATCHDVDTGGGPSSKSALSTGLARRQRQSEDAVVFENRAFDGRDDVTGCDEAVDNVEPGTSLQGAACQTVAADDCRQVSSGYLADTELDNLDWSHDPDTAAAASVALPAGSVYLGLSRLRGGRTVRLVWRIATVAVTSACLVCCLHIYSMLGVFGVLSNDRPASAWPWFAFQTLYR